MILRTWRSAARNVFSVDPIVKARRDAVSTRFRVKAETRERLAERAEAEAIAAEKRELQRPYPLWRGKIYRARVAALADRERTFRERVKRRREKDLVDLELAIQTINEGKWPGEEKDTSVTSKTSAYSTA